jgi:hypothetical protein
LGAHGFFVEGEWAMRPFGISREALPVALERKRNALDDADRREKTPSAEQAGLSGRQPHFFHRQQAAVMKNYAMNHSSSVRSLILAHNLAYNSAYSAGGPAEQQWQKGASL